MGAIGLSVILRKSDDSLSGDIGPVYRIGAGPLPSGAAAPGAAPALAQGFELAKTIWLELARDLGKAPAASLAHAPSCAGNVSDMGAMLAWSLLVEDWGRQAETRIVVCDDPWMYRHLASLDGVEASTPPRLRPKAWALAARGYLARIKVSASVLASWLSQSSNRRRCPRGGAALLVYGHPDSDADGADAYFGGLLSRFDAVYRMIHVDCAAGDFTRLSGPRTFSLHAFGSPLWALGLAFKKWRPDVARTDPRYAWIVRRAAALEGGTGQPAMIAWQEHCQARWINFARPETILWPWENHAWERELVRAARRLGIRTAGYQHTLVGSVELNHSARSNWDPENSLPDRIVTNGPAGRAALVELGHKPETLTDGGSFRMPNVGAVCYAPDAPVFVALPFDHDIAGQMVDAVLGLAAPARKFLVRPHPMTPHAFDQTESVRLATAPLFEQPAISAVVFAATTVGLEAVLAGIPTIRFLPCGRIANDIVPAAIEIVSAAAEDLGEALENTAPPDRIDIRQVFSSVDLGRWQEILFGQKN